MSKHKDNKALVGRVKKAIKKTRRKLSEEQFDKELQRTINFLSELKDHVSHLQAKAQVAKNGKVAPNTGKPKPEQKDSAKKPEAPKAKSEALLAALPVKAAVTGKAAQSPVKAVAIKAVAVKTVAAKTASKKKS